MTDRPAPPGVAASSGTRDLALAGGETDVDVQLIARQESLQAALEVAQALLAGQEPATMWGLFAHRARRLVSADMAIVRTLEEDGVTLVLRGHDPPCQSSHQRGILVRKETVAAGICGAVYRAGRPRIIRDVGALYKAAGGLRCGAPGDVIVQMPQGPALIVPLGPKRYHIGTLMAVNQRGGRPFERRDVDLLRSFATETVLALQQAELRRERRRRIVLEERERLARELHDDAIQSLRDITYGLADAADRAGDPILRERVASLVATLENVIGDLRNHIYGLCPSVLSGRSVEEALRQLVADFEKQSGVSTVVEVESEEAERLRDQASEVVQIVREALSNVWRHARARRCRVSLRIREDDAWLLVQDDGVGFDPSRIQPNGHGLGNFRERVDRLGGRLEIESWSNIGTTLRITIPLDQRRKG